MSAFHDVQFPLSVSFSSSGGPERRTEIVTLESGHEERNTPWQHARRRYDAGIGIRSLVDIEQVLAFFEARAGRLHGFRWKDFTDCRSASGQEPIAATDQDLGIGDGIRAGFQLSKTYGTMAYSYTRPIAKPIVDTVVIAVDGSVKTQNTHFSINADTGEITFLSGYEPLPGQMVSAGFQFDVPVRFDTDYLAISVESFSAGAITSIPIVEIR